MKVQIGQEDEAMEVLTQRHRPPELSVNLVVKTTAGPAHRLAFASETVSIGFDTKDQWG